MHGVLTGLGRARRRRTEPEKQNKKERTRHSTQWSHGQAEYATGNPACAVWPPARLWS